MNLDDLARLMGMGEAAASVALDGETQHVAAADGSCCWRHAMAKIAELEAEVERLRSWLRECDAAIGGDGSDESLLWLVYTCGAAKDALAKGGE